MDEDLAIVGLAVALLGLFTGLYFTMPLEHFISLLAMAIGFFAVFLYPWALAYIETKFEKEKRKRRSPASRPQNCASLN